MKLMLSFIFLLGIQIVAFSQVTDADVSQVIDSLSNDSAYAFQFHNSGKEKYPSQELYDSVQLALIQNYIQKDKVAKGVYNWPFRAFDEATMLDTLYQSTTFRYLLRSKYHIYSPEYVGCVWQNTFPIYDSLIHLKIQKKYGIDFWGKAAKEFESIETNGLDLKLPIIENRPDKDAIQYTKRYLLGNEAIQEEMKTHKIDSIEYLILFFSNGGLDDICLGIDFLGGVQCNYMNVGMLNEILKSESKKLEIESPTFNNAPATISVIIDFNRKEMRFAD